MTWLVLATLCAATAACTASPHVTTGPTATVPTATPGLPESTPLATASPTTIPSAGPSPTIYTELTKLAEGGHGGPPVLDLPAEVAVDYAVRGSCSFGVRFDTEAGDPTLPSLSLDVTGPEITGTWPIRLEPGQYYVVPDEAVGCTYSITVRADR